MAGPKAIVSGPAFLWKYIISILTYYLFTNNAQQNSKQIKFEQLWIQINSPFS
jgi:hypothetical protein